MAFQSGLVEQINNSKVFTKTTSGFSVLRNKIASDLCCTEYRNGLEADMQRYFVWLKISPSQMSVMRTLQTLFIFF